MSDDIIQGGWQRERAWLGYAGLLPFLGCLAVLLLTDELVRRQLALDVMRYYAAVIASFLGAVHWGVAANLNDRFRRARLRWGVMPALIAWTLLILPPRPALTGFAILFGLILVVDRHFLPLLDDSYRQLRLRLSVVVIAALLGGALLTAPVAT